MGVTFDADSTVTPAALDTVLRGPYQSLNANDIDAAIKIISGTARSMGITVVD